MVMYLRATVEQPTQADILWGVLERITRRIAWELPQYQSLSQYLTQAQGPNSASASVAARSWTFDYLSTEVALKARQGGLTNRGWAWDPWGMVS